MTTVWSGTQNTPLHPTLHTFGRSLPVDFRLWPQEIQGTKAHVSMLHAQKLLDDNTQKKIFAALDKIESELISGELLPDESIEDIHSLIELKVIEYAGPEGSNIHLGRSRNEQTILNSKLFIRNSLQSMDDGLKKLIQYVNNLASEVEDQCMPSYTHLQRAIPIYIADYWQAHISMWERTLSNLDHFKHQLDKYSPMGAGAINGTTLPTSPSMEAYLLGFQYPPQSSLATVSNRTDILEFAQLITHWMIDISRLMEDLIIWSSSEFGFISFAPGTTTGSSMMPQKKNPDFCELIRGKTATAIGHYSALQNLIKGLPMGYMKDLQEDKVHLFALSDLMTETLAALHIIIPAIGFNEDKTTQAVDDLQLLATDIVEQLILQGIPFRQAYKDIAQAITVSINDKIDLRTYLQKLHPDLNWVDLTAKKSCQKRSGQKG